MRTRRPRPTCWPSSSIRAALFVARWRDLLLALIDEDAMHGADPRREFRALVSDGASQATPEAVGYRLVRTFRSNTLNAMWRSLATGLLGEKAAVRRPGQFEAAGWRLVSERPSAVAPPGGGEWRAFLLQRVDSTIAELMKDCGSLASCEFGRMEPVAVRHPLSGALPLLPKLLDMPTLALAGDHHMPRVQDGSVRRVGAIRGFARPRARWLSPAARRAIRASAVAVLSQRLRRLGEGRAHAIPARPDSA